VFCFRSSLRTAVISWSIVDIISAIFGIVIVAAANLVIPSFSIARCFHFDSIRFILHGHAMYVLFRIGHLLK
jgi:hypothetical protein